MAFLFGSCLHFDARIKEGKRSESNWWLVLCLGGKEDNDIETTAYSWQDPIGNSHRRIIGRKSLINIQIVSFSQSPIERVQPWQARRE